MLKSIFCSRFLQDFVHIEGVPAEIESARRASCVKHVCMLLILLFFVRVLGDLQDFVHIEGVPAKTVVKYYYIQQKNAT